MGLFSKGPSSNVRPGDARYRGTKCKGCGRGTGGKSYCGTCRKQMAKKAKKRKIL